MPGKPNSSVSRGTIAYACIKHYISIINPEEPTYRRSGNYEQAIEAYQQALTIWQEVGVLKEEIIRPLA